WAPSFPFLEGAAGHLLHARDDFLSTTVLGSGLLALTMARTLADEAREALRLAEADPRQSALLAASVVERAKVAGDLAAAAIAERADGLAALHVYDAVTALKHLRAAVALGCRARSPQLAAEARMTLAYVLNGAGQSQQALAEIDTALADLTGVERARAD